MSQPVSGPPPASGTQPGTGALSPGMLRVPAQPAYLPLIGTVVTWFGGRAGLGDQQCQELEVAVDEACTNVIRHAAPQQAGGELTIVCSPLEDGLAVTVRDKGKPFNPREGTEIAREKRSRDPASGGMGLLLIYQLADEVHYRWDEQKGNQLTLIKHK